MSSHVLGTILRNLRESQNLALREVSLLASIDVAVLSKMERGERRITKDAVVKLSKIYNSNTDSLLILFLSEKILSDLRGEDLGEMALEEATKRLRKINEKQSNGN